MIESSTLYSQGARANYSGSMNEMEVNEELRALELSPAKRKYESSWSTTRLSEVDCDLAELGICAEYKYQEVSGTADQKGGTELLNAADKIECADYVLVFSGAHWEGALGTKMFNFYKRQAAKLNKHPETFCIAAKRLHVMTKPEFIEFVQKKIMDKETK